MLACLGTTHTSLDVASVSPFHPVGALSLGQHYAEIYKTHKWTINKLLPDFDKPIAPRVREFIPFPSVLDWKFPLVQSQSSHLRGDFKAQNYSFADYDIIFLDWRAESIGYCQEEDERYQTKHYVNRAVLIKLVNSFYFKVSFNSIRLSEAGVWQFPLFWRYSEHFSSNFIRKIWFTKKVNKIGLHRIAYSLASRSELSWAGKLFIKDSFYL